MKNLSEKNIDGYSSNWFIRIFHLLVLIVGVYAIFDLPVTGYFVKSDFEGGITAAVIRMHFVGVSPIKFFSENSLSSIEGFCCLLYLILFAYMLFNFIVCLIPSIGHGSYAKNSKILECIISILSLIFHGTYIYSSNTMDNSTYEAIIDCSFPWLIIGVIVIMLSIIGFFLSKKNLIMTNNLVIVKKFIV